MKLLDKIDSFKTSIKNKINENSFFKKIRKPVKFISTIISWTIFVLLSLVAVVLFYYFISSKIYAAKGAGYEPKYSLYTIISPSMVPNIKVYDVVMVKHISNPEDIMVGDVITFNSTSVESVGKSVTHRVIEIIKSEDGTYEYSTKGDNNFIKDSSTVPFENLTGKVIGKIPQLGRIQFFLASGIGWIIVVVLPALYVIIKNIFKILRETKTGQKLQKNLNKIKELPIFKKQLFLTYKPLLEYKEKPKLNQLPNISDYKDLEDEVNVIKFKPKEDKKTSIKDNEPIFKEKIDETMVIKTETVKEKLEEENKKTDINDIYNDLQDLLKNSK